MVTGPGPRVVLVTGPFPETSETFIASTFVRLAEAGMDIHVVCNKTDENAWASFPDLARRPDLRKRVHPRPPLTPRWRAALRLVSVGAVSLVRQPTTTLKYLRLATQGTTARLRTRFLLDSPLLFLRPGLIHFQFGFLALDQMPLKEALGCRVVTSFRGADICYHGLEEPGYYDEVWGTVDTIHVLSADLSRRTLERGCPPDLPQAVIPPSVDTAFFSPPDREKHQGPLRLLSVGRIHWKKGHEYALQAVALLRDRGVDLEFRVIGDGPHHESIRTIVRDLGLEGTVRLLGALSQKDVRLELASTDVFIHAAVSEGFGNVVLEAQAMEVPVVCTDAEGLPENVEDGVTGFVVPKRDPQTLAERVGELANDRALRRRMGVAGRRRVLSKFRPEDQTRAFVELYESLMR